eukprot:g8987.t1
MRAARAIGVLQLLLATAAATTSSTTSDEIPEVGIGAVHPICDPLEEECVSADEQVQDEIIAGLEADDDVTATPNVIELGELLCDSLDEASSSTMLRFAISSNETVTAEQTSYSELDGAAFSDNKERKAWKGEVVNPAPAADAAPSIISMTWTSECETETFVLRMTTRIGDDTISITETVPCAAGSVTDICVAQERSYAFGEQIGQYSEALAGRQLQSTVEVDVMVLYDTVALESYTSADQLETRIADELSFANEATANSLVNVQFNLVHTGLLPYVVQSTNSPSELFILRQDTDVLALRNQYQADLVVVVGDFTDYCGYAYINPDTQPEDETYGFSVLHRNCFDGRTLTHEIGHNMGADHDRFNTALTPTEYSHGLRYCAADSPARFRTIMSYRCSTNTQEGESSSFAQQINYFSNPDVLYEGLPTGTPTENVARTLRENMVAVSNFRNGDVDPPPPTPAPVVEGSGCSGRDGGDDFSGKEACCTSGVKDLDRTCSANVGAPCVLSDGSGCSGRDGGDDFSGKEACCTSGVKDLDRTCSASVGAPCVLSDGSGCSGRDGGDDFSGKEACCTSGVKDLDRTCSASVGAPCVLSDDPSPPTPAPVTEVLTRLTVASISNLPWEPCGYGIVDNDVAGGADPPTPAPVTEGSGCSGRDGGDDFSGKEACCTSGVKGLGRTCSASVGAPCVVSDDPPPPTPAPVTEVPALPVARIFPADDGDDEFTCDGVEKGDFCCSDGCGECGGTGCSNRGGGLTEDDCCTKKISESGRLCSETGAAPCFID